MTDVIEYLDSKVVKLEWNSDVVQRNLVGISLPDGQTYLMQTDEP